MSDRADIRDLEEILRQVRRQVQDDRVTFGPHSIEEMENETPPVSVEEVEDALLDGQVLENYPDASRGPCCLIYGDTTEGRPIHVVCTTGRPDNLFIITVYEPKPPTFASPTQRSESS